MITEPKHYVRTSRALADPSGLVVGQRRRQSLRAWTRQQYIDAINGAVSPAAAADVTRRLLKIARHDAGRLGVEAANIVLNRVAGAPLQTSQLEVRAGGGSLNLATLSAEELAALERAILARVVVPAALAAPARDPLQVVAESRAEVPQTSSVDSATT